jgi:hypothetical protein
LLSAWLITDAMRSFSLATFKPGQPLPPCVRLFVGFIGVARLS